MGLRLVGALLVGCGVLLLGFASHASLVQLLTDAFPVWRAAAQADAAQRRRIVRSQMRATAVVLVLLGSVALAAR